MMRTLFLSILLIMVAGPASARISLPPAQEQVLENGLTLKVIERHDLPLFSFQLTFRAGSTADPVGKEGLASLTNEMMMRGTKTRTARQIADQVAFVGGSLGNFCGRVSAGFDGEFLSADAETGFEILADLVLNSTLTDDELEKTRHRLLGGLSSRKESPRSIAGDAIFAALLGDSRFAHYTGGEPAAVASLTGKEIARFRADHYTPDNAVLVVCGDVSAAEVQNWVSQYLGKWLGTARLGPVEKEFPQITGREVLVYDKKDASQTQIRIGGQGINLGHADFPAVEVARTVFGGSFTSRLMNEIRVNRGLSYGVSGRSYSYLPGGLFYVSTFTKNATVGEVIDIILAESARMRTELVPDSELVGAMNYRCGTYPLAFETNDHLVGVFSDLWLDRMDKSYYEDYQENLRGVTSEQARAVAGRYFPGNNYRLVLVGKADEIMEQAKKYGTVTVVPLSDE